MPDDSGKGTQLPLTYHLLDTWMRVVTWIVPRVVRGRWRAEWDGELWYGVAADSGGTRVGTAVAIAVGMLRDAIALRRLELLDGRHLRRRGDGLMLSLLSDVRHSLRMLRKAPGFTAIIVLTLSLGIGSTTAIFTVVNALLLNPLPFPDAGGLVVLWQGRTAMEIEKDWFSPGQFVDVRDRNDVFEDVTLSVGGAVTMTGRGLPRELGYIRVTSSFFDMFGGAPTLGRLIDEGDDRDGADMVAVLTYELWQTAFGADPDVVGQTVTIVGRDFEIVGVLEPDFLLDAEVFPVVGAVGRMDIVLSMAMSEARMSDRNGENYNIFARLKPGVTVERAQVAMDAVAEYLTETYEEAGSGFFIRVMPLLEEVVGGVRQGLLVLLASVGVLLLIACGNVANLLLSRAGSRQRELGVRAAVGAGRGRLVRQLLTESAMLAFMGGTVGVALALAGVSVLGRLGGVSLPRLEEIGVHGPVLAFAVVTTMATTVVFGLLPTLRLSGINVAEVIKCGGRGTLGGGAIWSRFNLSSGLVIVEIGLSLVLLIGGGLLTRSLGALQQVDPGFAAERLLTFRFSLSGESYGEDRARIAFVDELESRLAALPGVLTVGATSQLPFAPGVSWGHIRVEGYVPPEGGDEGIVVHFRSVTPDYFPTMGYTLLAGRGLDESDRADGLNVVVIDQRLAEKAFPDRDPIGGRISGTTSDWAEVVGVVAPVKDVALEGEPRFTVYFPNAQFATGQVYMTVKTSGDPTALAGTVQRIVAELDDRVAVVDMTPMSQRVADSLAPRRFSMRLLQAFSLIALLLAAVGIYGLVSYRVSQGTHELGMRMALGAPRRTIINMVLGHGMALAGIGVGLGLAGALGLTRLMTGMLFEVSPTDASTYAAVSALLVVITLYACLVPARRATRVDPLDALRAE
jgi:predicted permease